MHYASYTHLFAERLVTFLFTLHESNGSSHHRFILTFSLDFFLVLFFVLSNFLFFRFLSLFLVSIIGSLGLSCHGSFARSSSTSLLRLLSFSLFFFLLGSHENRNSIPGIFCQTSVIIATEKVSYRIRSFLEPIANSPNILSCGIGRFPHYRMDRLSDRHESVMDTFTVSTMTWSTFIPLFLQAKRLIVLMVFKLVLRMLVIGVFIVFFVHVDGTSSSCVGRCRTRRCSSCCHFVIDSL
mmetsp:Transcript_15411/g.21471  ORF Transcript_15411/g.21471 Transcript_15411/m.21471 type:complete len:239 (-) Transcript_15411:98-814(-)